MRSKLEYTELPTGTYADKKGPRDFTSAGRGYAAAEVDIACGQTMTADQLEHFVIGYLSAIRDRK